MTSSSFEFLQLPIPGTVPLPPQIPRDLRSATPESDPSSPVTAERQDFYAALPGHKHSYSRPQRSPSAWSSNRDASPRSTSHAYPSYESTRTGVSGSTVAITKTGLGKETRGYESPTSDGDPDEVHETISKAIDTIIQKDPGWVVFFRAKAAPQRVSEVLKHYRFVQRMMDEWVEKKAPFRTSHHVVEAVSIAGFDLDLLINNAILRATSLERCTSMIRTTARPARRLLHYLRSMDLRVNVTKIAASWPWLTTRVIRNTTRNQSNACCIYCERSMSVGRSIHQVQAPLIRQARVARADSYTAP